MGAVAFALAIYAVAGPYAEVVVLSAGLFAHGTEAAADALIALGFLLCIGAAIGHWGVVSDRKLLQLIVRACARRPISTLC
jgi:hypothetical protein